MRAASLVLSLLLAATAVTLVAPAASADDPAFCTALLDANGCPWTICWEPEQTDANGQVSQCEWGIYGYPCQYCKPLE
jgi:hypothetical protein